MKYYLLIPMFFILSSNVFAQSFEVLTGPFGDSTNYIRQNSSFKINRVKGAFGNIESTINITNYKQCNQTWSNSLLGTCSSSICQSGCAMTDVAILLKANGVNVDPGSLNTWLTNNSKYVNGCDIDWTVIPNYPGSTLTWYKSNTYSLSILKSEIDDGNPVIVKVDKRYGGTGTCGHFVVVYGYNNNGTSTSDFLVSDPGTVTCPTGCNLSYYTICAETYPLRIYHNVSSTVSHPSNDNCPGTLITSNGSCLSGTIAGATTSYGPNQCSGSSTTSSDDNDVYYQFTAMAKSHTVTVSNYSSDFDAVIELRSACSTGTSLGCYDPTGKPTSVSYTWDNLTIGNKYFVRVFEFNNSGTPPTTPTFTVCVTHTASATATISNVTFPGTVNNGTTFSLGYTISATGNMNVLLGASIRRNSQDYSDISNDNLVSLTSGNNSKTRSFNLSVATPSPISAGTYDVIVALWLDKNGNGKIDNTIDEQLNTYTSSQQLIISAVASCTTPSASVSNNSGTSPLTMSCSATGGSGGSYAYKWYSGTTCSGTVLGTNSTLNVTYSGYYACKVFISGYESTCYSCSYGYATINSAQETTICSWNYKSNMPAARDMASSATYGNFIYIFGGNSSKSFYKYDAFNDVYTTMSPLPSGHTDGGAALLGNKIYLIHNASDEKIRVYDIASDSWATKSSRPIGNLGNYPIFNAVNNYLYAIGGCDDDSNISNQLDRYDPTNDTWTTINNPIPTPRWAATSVVCNNQIYVIGGITSSSRSNAVEVYDPATNTWTTKAPLPSKRNSAVAELVNNKIYVIGGFTGSKVSNSIYVYDIKTDSWSTINLSSTFIYCTDAVSGVVNNKIYIIGGYDLSNTLSSTEELNFCPTTDIKNLEMESKIKIFPNPTTGKFEISEIAALGNKFKVDIIDFQGKTIYSSVYSNFENKISLDLNIYPEGIYLIRLSNNESAYQKKVIKN